MTSHLPTLRETGLLDAPPEAAFDRLTRLAAGLVGAPVALVSLVDEARLFLTSSFGLPEPWASRRETPLSLSFCPQVTRSGEPLVVSDAREHPELRSSRAIPELGIVAYAGLPLVVDGHAIGAFCVMDGRPREWTDREVALLTDLAASVVSEIRLRSAVRVLEEADVRQYRDLYENAPDMFLTADLDTGRIMAVNRRLCEALGYDQTELVGQQTELVYPEEGRHLFREATLRLRKGGELADVERRLRRRDGTTFEVSLTLRGLQDPRSRSLRAFAIFRDITRRKQVDRDGAFLLRLTGVLQRCTSEEQILTSVASELGGYLGADRCFFLSNDPGTASATLLAGYAKDGDPLPASVTLDAFAPEARSGFATGQPLVAPEGMPSFLGLESGAVVAVPNVRPEADEGWTSTLVLTHREPRVWEEREVTLVRIVAERAWLWVERVRVLARLRDREVAEAVERTEEHHRVLLDGVKDYAVFLLDPEGRVATWNPGAERLKQYSVDEIVGERYDIFFPEEDVARRRPWEILEEAARTGRFEEEGWRVRKDRSRFWAEIVVSAIRGPDGALDGYAKIARDVTDRRRREEELATKQSELVRGLKEREVLLQEVHHRVKNNLQIISSLINMQARRLEHGETRAALEECRSRVLTIALIHQNLYQSKDYARVQLSDYVRTLGGNVLRAAGLSPTVTLDIDIDDIPLGIDRALPCGLIINELITNALKHAFGDRRGRLRVELKVLPRPEGHVRLVVADDGVGLPPDFDIRKSRSLGMQLVATLADQLGGALTVSNDGGARFAITFAAEELRTEAPRPPPSDRGASADA